MPKHRNSRNAFTLIEVMVAVVIVSIVIAALLEMQGNTHFKFLQIKEMMQANQYTSFLLSQGANYGFEEDSLDMKRLVDDFDMESDLRRKLSSMKAKITYEELTVIDTNEFIEGNDANSSEGDDTQETQTASTGIILEIGKTMLKSEKENIDEHLIRVRVQ